jgi:hypothetical protein
MGVDLLVLLLGGGYNIALLIKNKETAGCGALVDGGNVFHKRQNLYKEDKANCNGRLPTSMYLAGCFLTRPY